MSALEERYAIDILAAEAGGYAAAPTAEDVAFLNLLFEISKRYNVRYNSASPKEKYFVEEVARVTWERLHGRTPSPVFVA